MTAAAVSVSRARLGLLAVCEMGADLSRVAMITRSLRILDLDRQLRDLAEERGIGATTLMREILQAWVTGAGTGAVVRLADVQRVIASLARPA
ncbi:hypothetical protein ACIRRA_34965 [Nocardia sp. NPDC101769]|uniref:hypothetical protein n=1 Tax=Nocardia sp. NPDC101769 TaxID=3364333 RepID=UPI0037F82C13